MSNHAFHVNLCQFMPFMSLVIGLFRNFSKVWEGLRSAIHCLTNSPEVGFVVGAVVGADVGAEVEASDVVGDAVGADVGAEAGASKSEDYLNIGRYSVAPKILVIGIDNWSNLKYRKRFSIIILSNIAQLYL
jgi:hypothetical protein